MVAGFGRETRMQGEKKTEIYFALGCWRWIGSKDVM
jgi:hypothetical protein